MALSGLDIFKLLPKTNCGECGVPTCMAFAMKLAQKKAELSECPYASEDAKTTLGAASEPPIRLVKIGSGNTAEVGNETVMFRHEKTFFHQTGIAIELCTSEGKNKLLEKIKEIENYGVERVGETLTADLYLITHDSSDPEDCLSAIKLAKEHSTKGIILNCRDDKTLREGLEIIKDDRPAILLQKELSDKDIELAVSFDGSLILTGHSYDDIDGQAKKAKAAGLNSLILNLESDNLGRQIQDNTILRRSALKKNIKSFGYPLFSYVRAENNFDLLARASALICKYASIIALPEYDKALLYSLFTLRQNIFTDPQKPIQVDPKVYPVGDPTPESPIFITTNFSLSYFMVSGEIENSGISAHLVVADAEGQSVLTAWAAGKFNGETIAKFIKDIKLEEQVKTRKIVIPGFVSMISGDLEENLPGWEVIVGCQEASDIPSFVKNVQLT
ncbi:MAG: acetyl-CoA decarbonylase/synthase complex subunit gamma [Candidatus Latescibacteria bacterium]|nr:acetyl-CoA decarbonylase/synthase complex subunit gamma [Candidatus Latescibacterota bacterium]NIO57413.1 acetyl-CoA decarbonylase/synthase complex subunit gamma [Candidatus Latescibacterota bacterium]